jgi:hypothetical protein
MAGVQNVWLTKRYTNKNRWALVLPHCADIDYHSNRVGVGVVGKKLFLFLTVFAKPHNPYAEWCLGAQKRASNHNALDF